MAKLPAHIQVLDEACRELRGFAGQTVDVVDVRRPPDMAYAAHLALVVSKLSPLVGNMIEYMVVACLNAAQRSVKGTWRRQDPGFPDTIFDGDVTPAPGIEIKTWFPLATEITARFKDSVTHFKQGETRVAMLAWAPEHVLFGKPQILGVWIDEARGLAEARDRHYHKPPEYLVFEPEDTASRTRNLQQTNTNGYKFQGSEAQLARAKKLVQSWGPEGMVYSPTPAYQGKVKALIGKFPYRLDTNFAKMDRIRHATLETFKKQAMAQVIDGRTVRQWKATLRTFGKSPDQAATMQKLIDGP